MKFEAVNTFYSFQVVQLYSWSLLQSIFGWYILGGQWGGNKQNPLIMLSDNPEGGRKVWLEVLKQQQQTFKLLLCVFRVLSEKDFLFILMVPWELIALQKVVNARGVISSQQGCQIYFTHVPTCKMSNMTHPLTVLNVQTFPTLWFCLLGLLYMLLTHAAKMKWLFFGVMKAAACDNMGMKLVIQEIPFISCVFSVGGILISV